MPVLNDGLAGLKSGFAMNLETEVICGYEVSSLMKHVWAVELDLVREFVAVCDRYGLDYRMMGGTLLGAVRHKGFIPWDNDIDIAMPRRDFNRLLEIGPEAFKAPYFFQTPVSEKSRYFKTYVKIRNGDTTAAYQPDFDKGINCGIFIDVFCLDEVPDNRLSRWFYVRQLNEIVKMQRFCLGTISDKCFADKLKHGLQRFVYRVVLHSPDLAGLFRIYHHKAGRFAGKKCREVAHLDFGYRPNFLWDRIDWESSAVMSFDGLELRAPAGYDAILRRQYGEYMRFPADKSTHEYYMFYPDVPYGEFIAMNER